MLLCVLYYVAEQLKNMPCKKLYCVVGFLRDKDLSQILPLLPQEACYLFTQAGSARAVPATELTERAAGYGLKGEATENVQQAIVRARELAGEEDMIFIGGNTYVVAEAL